MAYGSQRWCGALPTPCLALVTAILIRDAALRLSVGKRVVVQGYPGTQGKLAFYGPVTSKKGTTDRCGVAMDGPVGKNDGELGGVRCFKCGPKHGVFVAADSGRVTMARRNSTSGAAAAAMPRTSATSPVKSRRASQTVPSGSGMTAEELSDHLAAYYDTHAPGTKTATALSRTAKKHAGHDLAKLDAPLKKKFGETLTEFIVKWDATEFAGRWDDSTAAPEPELKGFGFEAEENAGFGFEVEGNVAGFGNGTTYRRAAWGGGGGGGGGRAFVDALFVDRKPKESRALRDHVQG